MASADFTLHVKLDVSELEDALAAHGLKVENRHPRPPLPCDQSFDYDESVRYGS